MSLAQVLAGVKITVPCSYTMGSFVLFLFVVASGIFISQALTAQKASQVSGIFGFMKHNVYF